MVLRIVRPEPAVVAARKREVAARYARANRKKFGPLTLAAIRASELTRLYKSRYPDGHLPTDDDGEMAARIMVYHLARLRDATRRMSHWLDRWAPWLDLQSHERLINDALTCPLRYRADKVAWKLRVTAAERTRLGLRTIGAIDQSAEQRKVAAKDRRRHRDRERRRAKGMRPRAEYEAGSTNREKPWLASGMSRATWYRQQMRQVCAPHISEIYEEQTCLTESQDATAQENRTD